MTPERRLEIEQAANLYGSANCWAGTTGTLATMIRELLDEVKRLSPIDFSDVASLPEYTFQIERAGEFKGGSDHLTLDELLAECDRVADDNLRFLNIYSNEIFQEHFYFQRIYNPPFASCIDTDNFPLSKCMADRCNLEFQRLKSNAV